jgi:hypothetical protein
LRPAAPPLPAYFEKLWVKQCAWYCKCCCLRTVNAGQRGAAGYLRFCRRKHLEFPGLGRRGRKRLSLKWNKCLTT